MPKHYYAAIDIGSTCIKSALLNDGQMQIVRRSDCPVSHQAKRVFVHWPSLLADLYDHLHSLAQLVPNDGDLHLGLCGQVSSVLIWDQKREAALHDEIPVWQDQSCVDALPVVQSLLAEGKDQEYLGQHLPLACNWLLVKLAHYLNRAQLEQQHQVLQLHDAFMMDLCGTVYSHPSSQISLAHVDEQTYHPGLLQSLGIEKHNLPRLSNDACASMRADRIQAFGLPERTYVYAGLADMYAGFVGFGLEAGQALWQCNTSEIFGVAGLSPSEPVCMRQQLHDMPIHYGSTVSGGSNINWFMNQIADGEDLDKLSQAAGEIAAGADGLIYLPYICGERAPHWNNNLEHDFINLTEQHSKAHKLRAIMEGVAYNKRWLMDFLPSLSGCVLAGGSTRNKVWNQIRSDITGLELQLMNESEIALKGVLRSLALIRDDSQVLAALSNDVVEQYNPVSHKAYAIGFKQFKQAHLEQGYPLPGNQELHYV